MMHPVSQILPHYTYSEYIRWEGRWELINGIPYAMSPSPAPRHQRILAKVIHRLVDALEKSDCTECAVYDLIDIKIGDDIVLQPDALIVCRENTKPYLDFPASMILEILSSSTALKDRNTKFQIYQAQGVKYYLIIDPDKSLLEIYKLSATSLFELQPHPIQEAYPFLLDNDCIVKVNFSGIF
jgi:Uma2 family endonuclease